MKNRVAIREKALLWAMLIMILPVLGACQKDGGMDEEGMIDLKDIPENPEYANLPLIGTTWKLVGFGNEQTGKIKPAEPKGKSTEFQANIQDTFILVFENNGEISGFSSTNILAGHYEFIKGEDRLNVINFGGTKANEILDGHRFMDTVRKVGNYNITSQGLLLYYSSCEYLLFEPKLE